MVFLLPNVTGPSHHLAGAYAFRTRRLDSQRRASDDRCGPQRPGRGRGVGGERPSTRHYPSKMSGRGLGLNALVASAGAALGPTVAAGILAVASWQWLFAVNIPIGIGAYLLGRKSLPDNPKSGSCDLEHAAERVHVRLRVHRH